MTSLAGKVAFVAGASRGIGAAVAERLAQAGAAVAVAGRSERAPKLPGTIHSVAGRIVLAGGRALAVPCDVTDEDSVAGAVGATVREFGGIDILIANAGVLWLGPVETTLLRRWQLCLDVNLTGVFLVTKAVLPHLRARGGGSMVAVTTSGVGTIDRGANAYGVSKAAAERLSLGLATDLKPDNIAVGCLSPSRVLCHSRRAGRHRYHRHGPTVGNSDSAATILTLVGDRGPVGGTRRPRPPGVQVPGAIGQAGP